MALAIHASQRLRAPTSWELGPIGRTPLWPHSVCLVSRLPPIPSRDCLPVPATAALFHLGDALQHSALSNSGYDDNAFDVMVGIADLLEGDQGWSTEQSQGWLERMGPWEEDF